ncbi:MAG: alpha-ketoglutarate-dependent 2,4-dichlorophenoxyacetate dioxygenase [Candidatus Paceibacteria bacterium]
MNALLIILLGKRNLQIIGGDMKLTTTPLHAKFGVSIADVDLSDVSSDHIFPEIRAAFEEHSALLFRGQNLDAASHKRLALLFGPLENRPAMAAGKDIAFEVSDVSNKTKSGVSEPKAHQSLNLQSNMLWHTDSTFLPKPALVNILASKTLPSSGGQTELVSTRAGWADMPRDMRDKLKDTIIWHRLSNSRKQISAELAALEVMTQWPDRPWRAVWPNPVNGREALLIASHAFSIEGMGFKEGKQLIAEAIDFCTQPECIYSHNWQLGDVLIWDERATMHRGQPWPYEEARSLNSICCSVTPSDGLDLVRIVS